MSATGAAAASQSQVLTPLILSVQDAPVPFIGSDGRTHLVYELGATNFTSLAGTVNQVEVIGAGSRLQTLDAKQIAGRLQPAGQRTSSGVMAIGTHALLFIHLVLATGASPPRHLTHRVMVAVHAREFSQSGGAVRLNHRPVAVIDPPLHGANYISADSCCDATPHTRAALPVNGRVRVAQRYAVD